jgi:hypothetical protein
MGQHIVKEALNGEIGNQNKIWDEEEAKRVFLHNEVSYNFQSNWHCVYLFNKTSIINIIYEYAYKMNSPN